MGRSPSHKKVRVSVPQWASEQESFRRENKYPYCAGTFPECPSEITPDSVHPECSKCPLFKRA